MTDTVRVLLTAAVLSVSALAVFAWRLSRIDASQPERLIGELRLAQWAALLLAAVGAVPVGFALANPEVLLGTIDVTVGVAFVVLGGFVLLREPRSGLLVAAAGLLAHALIDIAHRPGLLAPDVMPRWYIVGCAIYDVAVAAIFVWARRR